MSFKTRLLTTYQSKDSGSEILRSSPGLSLFNQYNSSRYPYLLTSSAVRQNNTQFDILIACPQYELTLNSDKTLDCSNKDLDVSPGFFETLENYYQQNKTETPGNKENLPFTGGWFVYLSYEMAEEIEPCLSLPSLPVAQPLAVAARCPAAIIIDKQNQQCIAIAETGYEHLLDEIEHDFLKIKERFDETLATDDNIELQSLIEADEAPYLQQVEKIKQYIIDGDIFQANLSRQWHAVLKRDVSDAVLFDTLSKHNPSSFAAMACLQNMTIISSSPERLVSLKNGIVETRPIAGTRPRDDNQASDEALAKELLSHPKEQAEHIMLIDLERNDLGRVCCPGTIEVNELMVLESWQHVHHIVSNVRGELESNKSPIDVLRAVFPGGTITGCPKVHCIEILA
ncbi:MAG: aminodeoxychorismate synthase, component I, partial [Gammaproteobacteria bacterium]|nr:aminodeoxychorismate synthase, component I [Gammaproteobacteria bacterium]